MAVGWGGGVRCCGGRVDEVVQRTAGVVCEFCEECLGFGFGEGTHLLNSMIALMND